MPEIKYAQLFAPPRQQAQQDPQTLRQQMLMHALQTAGSSEPIYSPAVGVGKMALGALAGWQMGQQERDAAEKKQAVVGALKAYGQKAGWSPEVMGILGADPAMGQSLVAQTLAAGIQPPMERERQARLAGLMPGTQQYNNFMIHGDPRGPAPDLKPVAPGGSLVDARALVAGGAPTQPGVVFQGQQGRVLTKEEAIAKGLDPAASWGQKPNGEYNQLGAPTTKVDIYQNQANKFAEKLNSDFADNLEKAKGLPAKIKSIHIARSQLDGDNGIIAGALAGQRLQMQKLGSFLGITDPKAIQNSETFIAALSPAIAESAKELGVNPTDRDLEFQRKAQAGDLTLDAGTIRTVLDINERKARERIKEINDLASQLMVDNPELQKSKTLMNIPMPPEYQSATAAPPVTGQSGAPMPPPAAIEMLRQNPGNAGKFDEVFGPGASKQFLGGP